MSLNCEFTDCKNEVHADIMWASKDSPQIATLCQVHVNELWERLNPLLQANLVWVRMDRPGSIRNEQKETL